MEVATGEHNADINALAEAAKYQHSQKSENFKCISDKGNLISIYVVVIAKIFGSILIYKLYL